MGFHPTNEEKQHCNNIITYKVRKKEDGERGVLVPHATRNSPNAKVPTTDKPVAAVLPDTAPPRIANEPPGMVVMMEFMN